MSAILGGDLKTNGDIIWKILEGEKSARRDIVLMNAAAALWPQAAPTPWPTPCLWRSVD